MKRRKATADEIKKEKKQQKMRIKVLKAARRSGRIAKEGKIGKAQAKSKTPISRQRMAARNKARY